MVTASRHFRVSTLVVLRRAHDLNQISSEAFFKAVEQQYEFYKQYEGQKKKREERKSKGGNFWASFDIRNGARFNAAVAESIRRQRITYAEAGSLFWITPASAARYMNRLGAAK
jgi:Zn-dependent peptidase ImmA (M78 family)